MSDMMAAIAYDESMYERRCKKFRETPRYIMTEYGISGLDIYGDHAKELEKRDSTPNKEGHRMQRYWVNQPSGLQKFHKYHGQRVLATTQLQHHGFCVCYFTEGDVISMEIEVDALSAGWPEREAEKQEDNKAQDPLECPYCHGRNFIPRVVYRHTEVYGGGIKNFRCRHCGNVVKAACFSQVAIGSPRMTDAESDW
jgi:DNA-directed RNA polymerase subunit RPC12/RpoP